MFIPKFAVNLLLIFWCFVLFVDAQYGRQKKVRFPPEGTRQYSKNTLRRWKLRTQPGVCIQFKLRGLHMESSADCSNDYLDVYDGLTNSSHRILHTCGIPMPVPKPFTSTSNSFLIVFFSDNNSKVGRGFEAFVTSVRCFSRTTLPPVTQVLDYYHKKCGNPAIAPLETGLHARQKRQFGSYDEYDTANNFHSGIDSNFYNTAETEMSDGDKTTHQNSSERIVGGNIARSNSWPWQVSIRFHGSHICGGAIVSPRAIISAAHCFKKVSTNPNDFEFWVGKHLKDSNEPGKEQRLYGERIILHPDYEQSGKHDSDLAVIKLTYPGASFSRYIHPICLPSGDHLQPADRSTCYVTGFGTTKGTGGDKVLKQAAVPIVSNDRCKQMDRRLQPLLSDRMLCAGYSEGGHDSCQGDSGGPLNCKIGSQNSWVLSGVVSFGFGCAGKNSPGVYVRINKFLPWLRPIITDLPY